MIFVLVGKFGFLMYCIKLVSGVLGLLMRWMVVFVILCMLCGGMLVVIFIVMLVILLSRMCGRCVGNIFGFCMVLLKFGC